MSEEYRPRLTRKQIEYLIRLLNWRFQEISREEGTPYLSGLGAEAHAVWGLKLKFTMALKGKRGPVGGIGRRKTINRNLEQL